MTEKVANCADVTSAALVDDVTDSVCSCWSLLMSLMAFSFQQCGQKSGLVFGLTGLVWIYSSLGLKSPNLDLE